MDDDVVNEEEEQRLLVEWEGTVRSYDPGEDSKAGATRAAREAIEDSLTHRALPILEAWTRVADLESEHATWEQILNETNDERVKEYATAQRVRLVEELRVARARVLELRRGDAEASAALMVLQDMLKTDEPGTNHRVKV